MSARLANDFAFTSAESSIDRQGQLQSNELALIETDLALQDEFASHINKSRQSLIDLLMEKGKLES